MSVQSILKKHTGLAAIKKFEIHKKSWEAGSMKKVSGIYLFSGKRLRKPKHARHEEKQAEKYKQDKANSSDKLILEPL